MNVIRNPKGRPSPKTYHHGVEVSGDVRTLYIAGQLGISPDGSIPEGIEAQTHAAYANIKAVLESADMSFADVVKTTAFLINPKDHAGFTTAREQATGGLKNASSLVFVAGLASPELLVEVEAIAVKEGP